MKIIRRRYPVSGRRYKSFFEASEVAEWVRTMGLKAEVIHSTCDNYPYEVTVDLPDQIIYDEED